ncbi:MAG: hypothetical protein MJ184_10580 [Treponema sp.]|uniref:hypothetical protein n=1 Tax=Treponema sp. TaxID=166 RepID=UPI00298E8EBD|nr:hypothetical protein [Treponema sp.]MCQ2601792.1 hypothetical protein [Treponema sp.]
MPQALATMYNSLPETMQEEAYNFILSLYEKVSSSSKDEKSSRGIVSAYANPSLIEKEKQPWKRLFAEVFTFDKKLNKLLK